MRILIIEDNDDDVQLIVEELAEAGGEPFEVESADTLSRGLERMGTGGIDVVLLDLSLPDSQGLDTVHRVRAHAPDVPIVVLTGLEDVQFAQQAIQAGAQQYLVKGNLKTALTLRPLGPHTPPAPAGE
jgi:DNA-binding response OmpR family regulator